MDIPAYEGVGKIISHRIYPVETMNLTHTAVLTVTFVLRLKPQREGVMQILFPKLKLGANYFMSPVRCSPAAIENLTRYYPGLVIGGYVSVGNRYRESYTLLSPRVFTNSH